MYERIKALCEERGLTIKELERMAGIGNGTIGKWASAKPNLESLEKVAHALGINLTDLFE